LATKGLKTPLETKYFKNNKKSKKNRKYLGKQKHNETSLKI
jgi:hypothetical protein